MSGHPATANKLFVGFPGEREADFEATLDPYARAMLAHSLSCAVVGTKEAVRQGLEDFVRRTGADELMITASMYDHAARLRSFEIVAEAASARQ